MTNNPILVVDDEVEISQLIQLYLQKAGFAVVTAASGTEAVELIRQQNFALAVLDIMLPGLDGLAVCQEIKRKNNWPVIFLSCRSDESDKIDALDIGDDYMTKPFSPGELAARVKAHLRRSAQDNVARQGLVFGELAIDLAAKQVRKQGKVLLLSATEFRLLSLLVSHPGRIYSAEQLFELIWQADGLDDARTVAVHISNLRKKIEADPARPQYIVTHRGLGYQFSDGWRLVR